MEHRRLEHSQFDHSRSRELAIVGLSAVLTCVAVILFAAIVFVLTTVPLIPTGPLG